MSASDRQFSATARRNRQSGLCLPHDQAAVRGQPLRNPEQVTGCKPDTARGWKARSPPPMDEDRRAATRHRIRPVPVGRQDQIVERIAPPQSFMRPGIGRADPMIVVLPLRIVRPQIPRSDRQRPGDRARHPVGPVETTGNPVRARRRAAIAFPLVASMNDPAASDRTGESPPQESHSGRRQHQIDPPCRFGRPHSRCPDFFALVAR